MKSVITGLVIGCSIFALLWCISLFVVTPQERQSIKESGAIAVYEGKATCEKALDQWVCKVRRN